MVGWGRLTIVFRTHSIMSSKLRCHVWVLTTQCDWDGCHFLYELRSDHVRIAGGESDARMNCLSLWKRMISVCSYDDGLSHLHATSKTLPIYQYRHAARSVYHRRSGGGTELPGPASMRPRSRCIRMCKVFLVYHHKYTS